jgi:hypothetical protein
MQTLGEARFSAANGMSSLLKHSMHACMNRQALVGCRQATHRYPDVQERGWQPLQSLTQGQQRAHLLKKPIEH